MDTGLTLKPAVSVAQMGDVRPATPAANPVTTELNPAKTVTAAPDAAKIEAPEDSRVRQIILDPQSREVIYRVVDERSRRVISQVPEEAMLRLHAYARAMLEKRYGDSALDTTA
jgi:short-subunit dehydrogenase